MSEPRWHPLFLRGIGQFNECQFFECHETWEELWLDERGPARLYYKGLIQAAVALFHLANGNSHGAQKLLAGAIGYLSPYGPVYLGLDVDRFLAELSGCVTEAIAAGRATHLPVVDPGKIPRIELEGQPGSAPDMM